MAEHIAGPLYYERMGRSGPPMMFIHPNPMDQSSWMFQMAHFSTWYRCIAVDVPGYGRSPKAQDGLTMMDMAQACWDAADEAFGDERIVLVGCSVGAWLIPFMYRIRPEQTAAVVLSGTGYSPDREFVQRLIRSFRDRGLAFRWEYMFQTLSPAFRATPMAHFFADLLAERNGSADLDSIVRQLQAVAAPDPPNLHDIRCPALILTGTEDNAHLLAFALKERIPGCQLRVIPGAGHVSHVEQPWLFDRLVIEFLRTHQLFPEAPTPRR